jgi:hypothetical protein
MLTERAVAALLIVFVSLASAGCELAGDIFQAGMVVGVLAVVLVIGLIVWLLRRVA